MAADDVLRLAWLADRDSRTGRRDALVTLALAEGVTEGATWVEQGRRWLIAARPDHVFAQFATLRAALADDRVAEALSRLRQAFPPGRVRWLLQRGAVRRGPYAGRRESLVIVLDDLFQPVGRLARARTGSAKRVGSSRPDCNAAPHPGPPPPARSQTPRASDASLPPLPEATRAELTTFYLTILLAIAILLAAVLRPTAEGTKAA